MHCGCCTDMTSWIWRTSLADVDGPEYPDAAPIVSASCESLRAGDAGVVFELDGLYTLGCDNLYVETFEVDRQSPP